MNNPSTAFFEAAAAMTSAEMDVSTQFADDVNHALRGEVEEDSYGGMIDAMWYEKNGQFLSITTKIDRDPNKGACINVSYVKGQGTLDSWLMGAERAFADGRNLHAENEVVIGTMSSPADYNTVLNSVVSLASEFLLENGAKPFDAERAAGREEYRLSRIRMHQFLDGTRASPN